MPIKPSKMVRLLLKAGFKEVPKGGGHRRFRHPDGRMHGKELTPYTQRKILEQAKIKL